MRTHSGKTLAQRQAEIDRAKRKQKKTKSKPPKEKTLIELMSSVRGVAHGYADKTDVEIFEMAGYGNKDEARRAYREAVESENADDGLVRAYLIGLLKQEASRIIEASANTPAA